MQTTVSFDYYNSLANSLPVDLLDAKQIGFVNDQQFGKQSKNLLKTAKVFDAANDLIAQVDHFYEVDTNGNTKSMKMRSGKHALKTYDFLFQWSLSVFFPLQHAKVPERELKLQ